MLPLRGQRPLLLLPQLLTHPVAPLLLTCRHCLHQLLLSGQRLLPILAGRLPRLLHRSPLLLWRQWLEGPCCCLPAAAEQCVQLSRVL